jgi:hypothetical protein
MHMVLGMEYGILLGLELYIVWIPFPFSFNGLESYSRNHILV